MDYEQAKHYCMSKPEVVDDYPFGPDALVLKVKGKLFAILGEENHVARTLLSR